MFDSQIPLTVVACTDKVTEAAWSTKKSYAIFPTDDGTINPVLETKMNNGAKCSVTETTGGHTFFMNHPEVAVDVIMPAAE